MKISILAAFFALFLPISYAESWEGVCNSTYKKELFKPNYVFTVKQGQVGGCKSDKLAQDHGNGYAWSFSERSEVRSSNDLQPGIYEWSALVNIERNCKPALRNTIFQLHAGGYLQTPPSWIGIQKDGKFRLTRSGKTYGYVPDEPFQLKADIYLEKTKSKVDYFVNGEYLATNTHDNQGVPYKKMFMKFGVYRVNANCDITQSYKNVRLKKK